MASIPAALAFPRKTRHESACRGFIRTYSSGFTLIELLVVVSIILVLVAILIPAISKARAQGISAKCLANIRGLSRCAYAYSGDYDDKLLPTGGTINLNTPQQQSASWYSFYILPYLPYQGVLTSNRAYPPIVMCPDQAGHNPICAPQFVVTGSQDYYIGYGLNSIGVTNTGPRLANIENPSSTVMFADTGYIPYNTSTQVNCIGAALSTSYCSVA